MKTELNSELCTKYPLLYKDRYEDLHKTAMCWGFECGDGWFKLLDTLSYFITNATELYKDKIIIVATQVKEKFGTLRFYWHTENPKDKCAPIDEQLPEKLIEYLEDLIRYFEIASCHVCEDCGAWAKTRGKGWLVTLCDKCWITYKNRVMEH